MVPMNVRQSSERLALGNRISSLFVELPVAERVAHLRHRQIVAATERLKSVGCRDGRRGDARPRRAGAAGRARNARPFAVRDPPVQRDDHQRAGPQIPLYAFGAQLREVHPVVPLAAAHSVGIAIFSYNGLVTFGVIADSESTPDIDVLAHGIEEGIDELLALVAERRPRAVDRRDGFARGQVASSAWRSAFASCRSRHGRAAPGRHGRLC